MKGRLSTNLWLDFGVTKNVIAWGEWEKLMGDVSFHVGLGPRCAMPLEF